MILASLWYVSRTCFKYKNEFKIPFITWLFSAHRYFLINNEHYFPYFSQLFIIIKPIQYMNYF